MDAAEHTYQAALQVTDAVCDLLEQRVWQPDQEDKRAPEPRELLARLNRARRPLLYRPDAVRAAAAAVAEAAAEYAALLDDLRDTPNPSPFRDVDARRADEHATKHAALDSAHGRFVHVIRDDLGVH